MADMKVKAPKKDLKLYIRCSDIESIRGFKRVAADFKNYEDVIQYLAKNYEILKKIAPSFYQPRGRVL